MKDAWPAGGRFLGVAERPYDQDLLTNIAWASVMPEPIRLRDLWLTQHHLSIAALVGENRYSTDTFPHVVRCEGDWYLEDGHHRMVLGAMRGELATNVRVVSLPARVPMAVGRD